ncbi:LuxR C-terminal-related transcriptional regulator [Myxosarcina sp. GI1]|uniref:LuxR C-terminal-related transcriptional regulator n=1 Tax=Myxosarcina sp. GI1 TaxID=1541065 RepID=UPI0005667B18|nr:LuxR C-terminal-related transcriptional regulator [Myxosarcina sp. GI1]
MSSLKSLVSAIALAETQLQLEDSVTGKIGEYFAAKRYRLFLLSQLPAVASRSKLFKLAISTEYNPVLRYLLEHHAPVHEEVLLPTEKWKTICPRFDHAHVMVGPIVDGGNLIGGLALTRDRHSLAFNSQNLLDLSALCLHISTRLTKIQSPHRQLNSDCLKLVTPRELQIARLVAQGLTNAEIGRSLWITENSVKQALKRMFRKLGVASRTEAIALLFCSSTTDC